MSKLLWWCTKCWGEEFSEKAPNCRHCGTLMEIKDPETVPEEDGPPNYPW